MPTERLARFFALYLSWFIIFSAGAEEGAAQRPASIVYAVQPTSYESMQHGELRQSVIQLAARLGVSLKFYVCPWARCLKAIEDGEADIIDDVYYSDQRSAFMTFIDPPYSVLERGFRFYSLPELAGAVETYADIEQFSVVTVRGNIYFEPFDSDERIRKLVTKHISQSIPLLYKQRVDLLIAPPSLTPDVIANYDPEGLLVEQPYQHRQRVALYYAVSRKSEWHAFISDISSAIRASAVKVNTP